MTPRERWLAALRLEPVDRLPFWPKLTPAYPRAQTAPFQHMTVDAIHDWIGSDRHVGIGGCTRHVRRNTSSSVATSEHSRVETFHTPHGSLVRVERFDKDSQSWHPVEFPVKKPDDIVLMAEWFADCRVEVDTAALERSREQAKQIGDDAATMTSIGTSALMEWVEHLAGIENAHLFLADRPTEVAALFEAKHRILIRTAKIVADKSPADTIYAIENTSTTLISPEQYRTYCYPHIMEYARIISGAGRPFVLHMCGHLKALLTDLNTIPAAAFEAFTSPPLGNTTLLDGRTACPDKCLIGGTNATLWTRRAAEIIDTIQRDLDALPHHRGIVVTSAGVMPPLCTPETIRAVCEAVKAYEIKVWPQRGKDR